jgi:large subunit ribosomal protein L2
MITSYAFRCISTLFKDTCKNINQFKPLAFHISRKAGRSFGRIVSPRRSNFYKRLYRAIDFKRTIFPGEFGIAIKSMYDPNRSALIMLVCYPLGVFAFILQSARLIPGDQIHNRSKPKLPGDSSKLSKFPSGILIHCVSLYPNRRSQLHVLLDVNDLIRKQHDHALLKLKSGELRFIRSSAIASWGVVGNELHFLRDLKYAGVMRHLGKRSRTRPSAMNPVDHPMGGRTRGGCTPMNSKGFILDHRSPITKHHRNILYTSRQLKFLKF